MLKLNVTHLLNEKGKSKYWLYTQMGMSYTNFNKMINHQTKGIRYQTIEKLCKILECSPNELILIVFEEKNNCT
mgnify:CR=1 FL=1